MADPKKTTVDVTYKGIDPANGKAIYDIKPGGTDPLPTGPDGLIFINDHFPGFDISFVLTDQTNQNFAFPPDSKKEMAVSSQMGGINLCPPQGTLDVFTVTSVGGQKLNTLTVHNRNADKVVGLFSYVLWITNDGGTRYVPLDPGGSNQNGPTSKSPVTSVSIVAAAIAVVALVALYLLGVFGR